MTLRVHALASALLVAACGGSDDQAVTGASTGSSGSGIAVPTSGSDTTGLDSTFDGGDGAGEPDYPKPDPVAGEGTCPADAFGPITFDGFYWVCLPSCIGDPPSCPMPTSGTAEAACATNPLSSSDPCNESADCTVEGELCGNIGGGIKGCLLPPSHCILRCDEMRTCPDTMACSDAGVCAYVPA